MFYGCLLTVRYAETGRHGVSDTEVFTLKRDTLCARRISSRKNREMAQIKPYPSIPLPVDNTRGRVWGPCGSPTSTDSRQADCSPSGSTSKG